MSVVLWLLSIVALIAVGALGMLVLIAYWIEVADWWDRIRERIGR